MIKFFRKIRQNMLTEYKLRKYLLYAIGEIVLVVIGILIALSIDNWNEERKDRIDEGITLESLKEVLEKDRSYIQSSTAFHESVQSSIDIVLQNLKENSTYHDSLSYHFWNLTSHWALPITKSVFETLKSKGVHLIKNEELRNEIIDFYDIQNHYFQQDQRLYWDLLYDASQNVFNTRFYSMWSSNMAEIEMNEVWDDSKITQEITGEMVPRNFEKLKFDQDFKYFLRTLSNRYDAHIKVPTRRMEFKINYLIKMIKEELK